MANDGCRGLPGAFLETIVRLTGQSSLRLCSFQSASPLIHQHKSKNFRRRRHCSIVSKRSLILKLGIVFYGLLTLLRHAWNMALSFPIPSAEHPARLGCIRMRCACGTWSVASWSKSLILRLGVSRTALECHPAYFIESCRTLFSSCAPTGYSERLASDGERISVSLGSCFSLDESWKRTGADLPL
jgi:hypothetical protein